MSFCREAASPSCKNGHRNIQEIIFHEGDQLMNINRSQSLWSTFLYFVLLKEHSPQRWRDVKFILRVS